jgi:hypothetical protein
MITLNGRFRAIFALLLLLSCVGTARAETIEAEEAQPASADQASEAVAQPVDDPDKWHFATIGYVWFAGAKGETDVIVPLDPVGLDLSFGDVLDAFKFAFMGAAEARKGRLVILGDLTYIHLDATKGIDIRNQDFLDAELDSRTAEITLVGGYRVVNEGPILLDLLGGGRLNFFKTSLQLEGPNNSAEGSVKEAWFDPLIAARANAPLGGKWDLAIYADVGGIVTGSKVTWQGLATVNYQISRKIRLGAGWRYFKVNYENGDFLYDVAQSGPILVFRTDF